MPTRETAGLRLDGRLAAGGEQGRDEVLGRRQDLPRHRPHGGQRGEVGRVAIRLGLPEGGADAI
eukprot:10297946-Alexandrium_andersonii.AAC.2